jgi:hypothetical protein
LPPGRPGWQGRRRSAQQGGDEGAAADEQGEAEQRAEQAGAALEFVDGAHQVGVLGGQRGEELGAFLLAQVGFGEAGLKRGEAGFGAGAGASGTSAGASAAGRLPTFCHSFLAPLATVGAWAMTSDQGMALNSADQGLPSVGLSGERSRK